MHGFRSVEIPIHKHARRFGLNKYGLERFIRGISDVVTMWFLRVYRERPGHFANFISLIYMFVSIALIVSGVFPGAGQLPGMLAIMSGVCIAGMAGTRVITGLLSELMSRSGLDMSTSIVSVAGAPEVVTNKRDALVSGQPFAETTDRDHESASAPPSESPLSESLPLEATEEPTERDLVMA